MDHALDRERVAERLLATSQRHWFDPNTEIDWDAPLDPDRFYMPPHAMELYGTRLWDRLSHRERVELSKHEASSVAYMGIWFEMILMQMLVRHAYHRDLTSKHVSYALTEIADECRHSMMFARLIDKLGTPRYRPHPVVHAGGWVSKTMSPAPGIFAGALVVEEILDAVQRITFPDESIQPIMRDVTRIHVIEEARHVRYAREELRRQLVRLRGPRLEAQRWMIAGGVRLILYSLVHPDVYKAVGLDPKQAKRVVQASAHRRTTIAWTTKRLREYFGEVGLMGGPSLALWRATGALS